MTFASPLLKLVCSDGAYLATIVPASLTPARFCCAVELSRYVVEYTLFRLAPFPSAASMKIRFDETLPTNVAFGDQPTLVAVTSAVMVCVGSAKITSVSQPFAFIDRICWVTL